MASVAYHLRQAAVCLRQSPWAATVAAGTVAVSLAVVGVTLMGARTVEAALRGVGADARLTVFLPEGAGPAQGEAWAKEAARAAGPEATAVFVTPAEALAKLQAELGASGAALSGLAVNPLPPTLEVKLGAAHVARTGLEEVRAAASRVRALPFAGDLDWGEGFVDRLETLLVAVRALGLLAFAIVLGLTLFLVGNVVRLTVYARRDEIDILRLVGATDGFIAAPFVVEGAVQGFAGGLVGGALAALAERLALPEVAGALGFGHELLAPPLGLELALFPLVGLTIGVTASLVATLRFLRAAP